MAISRSKSLEIVSRDLNSISASSRTPYYPFVVSSGRSATLYDADGNRYIDFFAGAASLNTGTCHPRVVGAIKEQAEKLICYTTGVAYEESAVELAEKLVKITPGSFKKKVAFGLSGSDTIDGAIKFARKFTGRSQIITFQGAYHGCTYGALSASAISLNMRRGIGPMLPGFHHFSYPICGKCPWKKSSSSCSMPCFAEIEKALSQRLAPEEVAAVIFEPIAGDIGVILPPQRYVDALVGLCKKSGILFVSDEVQQGMGRTGKWFACEHFHIEPDIMAMSKALASGMPLSALVMREDIADSLQSPGHCFTLAANALCCRAALATIDVIEDEKLLQRSAELGEKIKNRLNSMKDKLPELGDTRGLGLTIGQEIIKDDGSPNRSACAKICGRCWERGLIVTFLSDNVLRIQPPLVISDEEAEEGLMILEKAIEDYEEGTISDDVLSFTKGWS